MSRPSIEWSASTPLDVEAWIDPDDMRWDLVRWLSSWAEIERLLADTELTVYDVDGPWPVEVPSEGRVSWWLRVTDDVPRSLVRAACFESRDGRRLLMLDIGCC